MGSALIGYEQYIPWLPLATRLSCCFRCREGCPFTCCIIDEAGQCIEPEAFIPLEYGLTKLVLVGDHYQLPPTVTSQVGDASDHHVTGG